jgi:archaellum component FlaC
LDQRWIYIVLLGLVFIICAKVMPKSRSAAGAQNPSLDEIEEMMEHFTVELDEQNKALIQYMAEMKRDYEMQTARLSSRIEMLEKQAGQTAQEMIKLQIVYEELQKPTVRTGVNDQFPISEVQPASLELSATLEPEPEPEPTVVMNMKLRYAELFALYDQGKSADYIARKLSINKGEVNLIIQLAKQEERLNAQQ